MKQPNFDPGDFERDAVRAIMKAVMAGYSIGTIDALIFRIIDRALSRIEPRITAAERAAIMGYAGAQGVDARRRRVETKEKIDKVRHGLVILIASHVPTGKSIPPERLAEILSLHFGEPISVDLIGGYMKIAADQQYFVKVGRKLIRTNKVINYEFKDVESRAQQILMGDLRHFTISARLHMAGLALLRAKIESDYEWLIPKIFVELDDVTAKRLNNSEAKVPEVFTPPGENLPNYGALGVLRPASVMCELSRHPKACAGEAVIQYTRRDDISLRPTSAFLDHLAVKEFISIHLEKFTSDLETSVEEAKRIQDDGSTQLYELSFFYGSLI